LVTRPAYQGKLFKYLQKELREKEVQTIGQMIENDFTFIVPKMFNETSDLDFLKR
jgi:hypothetical protein